MLIPQNSFNPYAVPDIGILHNLSASMYTNPPEMVFPGCEEQTKGNKHFSLQTGRRFLVFSECQHLAGNRNFAAAGNKENLLEVVAGGLFSSQIVQSYTLCPLVFGAI